VVRLDDYPYTIAGVLPRGFALQLPRFPSEIDVWKVPDDWWQNGDVWTSEGADFAILDIVARLKTNATAAQAEGELEALASKLRDDRTELARAGLEYEAVPLRDSLVGTVRSQLLLLLGAVGLVLLAACANVTSLMLAKARGRASELGLRLALGSTRGRIARLLLAEASIYAITGGAAGVALAFAATRWITHMGPEGLPRLHEISIHYTVLLFALALTVGLTLVVGLVPALVATRRDVPTSLSGSRTTAGREGVRIGKMLVVTQLAASLVLWVGAALLTRSLVHLTEVNPGFDPENLLTFSVSLPGTKYERPEGTDRLFRQLESRIETLPGVRSAGVVWPLPLSGRNWSNTYVAGGVRSTARAYAEYRLATPGYFGTMAIPFLEGRNFSRGDRRHVVIVNHALAQRAFEGESTLGREIRANPWGAGFESFEVIGVVADVRYENLSQPPQETIYFDSRGWSWTDWEVDFVVRTKNRDPEVVVGAIREELSSLDASIPLARPRAMTAYLSDHLAQNRFALTLIGLFALVAGALTLVGLYGVLSHSVHARRHEIGIRMALGCNRRGILIWIYRGGMTLIGLGIALGVAAALLLGRFLESLLVGVTPTDGLTLAAAVTCLTLVASLACFLPARRAARVDPMSVLRSE
jgi:putative ABC transport system permease protein